MTAGPGSGLAGALEEADGFEVPPADLCLRVARLHREAGDEAGADAWARRVVAGGDDPRAWQAAAKLLLPPGAGPDRRTAKVALLGSWTTDYLAPMLRLAAAAGGLGLEIRQGGYGQYRQELLDERSATAAFAPDVVVLAVHEGEVALPELADDPDAALAAEMDRWVPLWAHATGRLGSRVVQHGFVTTSLGPLGHLGHAVPGSRAHLLRRLSLELGDAAPPGVNLVDLDPIVAEVGAPAWRDDRYWYLSKLAVSLDAHPALARHTAAVVAGQLGLSRKCLVLDLDNTLWGGVVGDDGMEGLRLGEGPDGEAFLDLQREARRLRDTGIVLAVCSKNDEATARHAFEHHPEMVLRLDDIACFVANWEPKSENLRVIAQTLDLGLDALVLLDDNPLERAEVRRRLPDVDVIALPDRPEDYPGALRGYLRFERAGFTADDRRRAEPSGARARATELADAAGSLEEFYASLGLQAEVGSFDAANLPRVAQLVGKTNQFNLTTRRHSPAALERFHADPDVTDLTIRLSDRFADHGLVVVVAAARDGAVLDVDTWLMSCRVIGRTVEETTLALLADAARKVGCDRIRATYLPTAKNGLVADVLPRLGFEKVETAGDGGSVWERLVDDIADNPFIEIVEAG